MWIYTECILLKYTAKRYLVYGYYFVVLVGAVDQDDPKLVKSVIHCDDNVPATDSLRVFRTSADRQDFITSFIHLLTPHLILASNENKSLGDQQESSSSKSHCLTGDQRASMENVLYQFMDLSSCPPVVKDIVQV